MKQFDRVIEIAATWDWVSPTIAAIQDFKNRPTTHLVFDTDCGYSARQIAGGLKKKGVKVWGILVIGDKIQMSIPKKKLSWAHAILRKDFGI